MVRRTSSIASSADAQGVEKLPDARVLTWDRRLREEAHEVKDGHVASTSHTPRYGSTLELNSSNYLKTNRLDCDRNDSRG